MLINEDFFDKEELDIESNFEEYDDMNQDNNYLGLIGMQIQIQNNEFKIDEKFNKILDNYEKAFSILFGNLGFNVEFERMTSMKFSEIQNLENTHRKDKDGDIAKLGNKNYRIFELEPYHQQKKIVECAKIYSDNDKISALKVIKMINIICPLSDYIYKNYHAVVSYTITFDKKLCSDKTPKEIMFYDSAYGVNRIVSKTEEGEYYNSKKLKEHGSREDIEYFFKICKTIKPDLTLDMLFKTMFKDTHGNMYEWFDLENQFGDIIKTLRVEPEEIQTYNGLLTTTGTKLHVLTNGRSYNKNITYSFEQLTVMEEQITEQKPGLYILKRGSKHDWTWQIFFDGAITLDEWSKKSEYVVSTEQDAISYYGDLSIENYDDFVRFSENNLDEDDFITQTLVLLFTTIFGINKKTFEKYNEFAKP